MCNTKFPVLNTGCKGDMCKILRSKLLLCTTYVVGGLDEQLPKKAGSCPSDALFEVGEEDDGNGILNVL